ncbi:hypothetical protein AGLY_004263 [Aphis glycines]|uniref:Uncharacterized protein n=1 Tax=Aphis glycines TaxID=307491 RepID=A0A6G0TXZ2_APHGL|nr:hypothetical protein AGLY_004263 [Aphis glycines]
MKGSSEPFASATSAGITTAVIPTDTAQTHRRRRLVIGYHDRSLQQQEQHVIATSAAAATGCDLCDISDHHHHHLHHTGVSVAATTAVVENFTVQLTPHSLTAPPQLPPPQSQCSCYSFPEDQHQPLRPPIGPVRFRGNCRLAVRTLPYPQPQQLSLPATSVTRNHHLHSQLADGLCHCRVATALAANQHQHQLSHQQMLFVPFSMPANYGNHIACPAQPTAPAGGGSAGAAAAAAAAAAAVATLSNGGNPNAVSPSAAATAIMNGNATAGLKVRLFELFSISI